MSLGRISYAQVLVVAEGDEQDVVVLGLVPSVPLVHCVLQLGHFLSLLRPVGHNVGS